MNKVAQSGISFLYNVFCCILATALTLMMTKKLFECDCAVFSWFALSDEEVFIHFEKTDCIMVNHKEHKGE